MRGMRVVQQSQTEKDRREMNLADTVDSVME